MLASNSTGVAVDPTVEIAENVISVLIAAVMVKVGNVTTDVLLDEDCPHPVCCIWVRMEKSESVRVGT